MSDTGAVKTPRPVETSTFRLYLMRALYLLVAVGLGAEVWPRVLGLGEPLGTMDGVAYSFWATLSLLAALGIRYPLKMVPLLLVQLVYKTIWLLAVALPWWLEGPMEPASGGMVETFLVGIVLDLVVIPWPYVHRTFVLAPGARWKAIPAGESSAAPSG